MTIQIIPPQSSFFNQNPSEIVHKNKGPDLCKMHKSGPCNDLFLFLSGVTDEFHDEFFEFFFDLIGCSLDFLVI